MTQRSEAKSPTPHAQSAITPTDLTAFEGPAEELARRVLLAQMRLSGASAGAMLADLGEGHLDLLAHAAATDAPDSVHNHAAPPQWLQSAHAGIEAAIRERLPVAGVIDSNRSAIVVPCDPTTTAGIEGVRSLILAFVIDSIDPVEVDHARERLADAAALAALVGARLSLSAVARRETALRSVCELLAQVNAQPGFTAAAMVLVNEIASRLRAKRVALGLFRGRGRSIRAVAFSHTERFVPASALVREVEAAMDEAADQDCDTFTPHTPEAPFIARDLSELARKHGPSAAAAFILRSPSDQFPRGALTIERDPSSPITQDESNWLRATLDLITPRLIELEERDAWLPRRLALRANRTAKAAASPKGLAWKLAAVAASLALISLFIIPTDLKARGTFVAQAADRRVIAAPFEGTIESVSVKVGDTVQANQTILATLDTTELALKLAEARAQRDALTRQSEAARAAPASGSASIGTIAEARLFEAQTAEADARVKLLESRLAKSKLLSPITGVVTQGDIDRLRGAAVNTGDTLFEIAAQEGLIATVAIPENRAADLQPNQSAVLTPTGRPDQRIDAFVERIAPALEVAASQNVVKVRVTITSTPPDWLRPGMEGVAAVTTGRASLMHAWTRGATDWLRMKLWW